MPIAIGAIVGKYKVDRILGIGGMAVVAAATHLDLGQRVALKVMRAVRMTSESVERFLTEARAAVSLKSDHVAKVLDVGRLPSGLPYIVMELLEGSDLATVLEREGALRPHLAIDYVLQACDAIAEAHKLGIVHRDLKPANLFLTHRRDGTPLIKVLDFGISKVDLQSKSDRPSGSRRSLTEESTVMGSPAYMSPEQIRSTKNVDARTDIWALGAILFELVTGHAPFASENIGETFSKILDKPPPRLETYLPNAPPGLNEIIAKCLEKDLKKRWVTVGAFALALQGLGVKPSLSTVPSWEPIPVSFEPPPSSGHRVIPTPAPLSRAHLETYVLERKRPSTLVKVAITVFAVLGGAFGAFMLFRFLSPADATTTAAPAEKETVPAAAPSVTTTAMTATLAPTTTASTIATAAEVPRSPAPTATTEPPAFPAAAATSSVMSRSSATASEGHAGKKPRKGRTKPKAADVTPAPEPTTTAQPPPPPPAPDPTTTVKKRERTDW
jgi:serine/threonine-protein kinase